MSTQTISMTLKLSLEYFMTLYSFNGGKKTQTRCMLLHVIFHSSLLRSSFRQLRHTFKMGLISNQGHMMPQGEVNFYCLVVSSEGSLLKSSTHDMTVRPLAVVEIKHHNLISHLKTPSFNLFTLILFDLKGE